jgi:hypothetical protein
MPEIIICTRTIIDVRKLQEKVGHLDPGTNFHHSYVTNKENLLVY